VKATWTIFAHKNKGIENRIISHMSPLIAKIGGKLGLPMKWRPVSDNASIFVSVVMPVYNGANYVAETIESILHQTHRNFEFIIVDDCSTDNSHEILERYALQDQRIKLYKTEKNHGNPGGASAFGVCKAASRSQYILMTDQDDISHRERLDIQVDFMERNPSVDISGGRMRLFGGHHRLTRPALSDDAIKALLLTSSPISNPTIIFRKGFLDENNLNYRNQTSHDYLLLAEAALEHGAVFQNLKNVLVYYRCHESQSSSTLQKSIHVTSNQVREYQLKKLGICAPEDIALFNCWKVNQMDRSGTDMENLMHLFQTIINRNLERQLYPHHALVKRLKHLYRKELFKAKKIFQLVQSDKIFTPETPSV